MHLLRRYRVGLVLLGLLVVVGVLVMYRLKDQQARAVTRPRPDVLVGVVTPERRTMEIKLAFTADIVPAKQAAIFSKVSGYIRRIHADRGDFVEAGQVLVEIDDLELQASSRPGPGHGRLEPGGARDGPLHARRQSSQPREPARQPRQGPRRRRQRRPSGRADEDPLRAGPRVRDRLGKRPDQLGVVAGQCPVRGGPAPARRRPDRHRREPGPALPGAARDQSGRAHARADQPRQYQAGRAVRRLRRPAQPGPGGGGERAVGREPTRPPWASSRCTISRR